MRWAASFCGPTAQLQRGLICISVRVTGGRGRVVGAGTGDPAGLRARMYSWAAPSWRDQRLPLAAATAVPATHRLTPAVQRI